MQIKREDLSFSYDADGFMLRYKDQNIGGAGAKLPREKRLSPTQRAANIRDNEESVLRDIDALVAGRGQARYISAIAKIDAAQSAVLLIATPDDLRSITEPGAESLTDAQAEHLKSNLIGLGYLDYVIPGPVWQRYLNLAKAQA